MRDALIGVIVGVFEPWFPIGRQRCVVHRKPMVLRGDVAPARLNIDARDILPTMAVGKFVGLRTRGECEKLIAEADAENGFPASHRFFNVFNSRSAHGWVARAV